ncbi:MAG: hypothetical protein FWE62_04835 [Firmicutes bacterium]|nr:hypothetical protein [Bacillota bacterium]
MITISALFFSGSALIGGLTVLAAIVLGLVATLAVNKLLTATILKDRAGHFTLELPPYRRPRILKTIWTAFSEKALRILLRAVLFSAPFSALIIVCGYIKIDGQSLLYHAGEAGGAARNIFGVDGFILLAFMLALPANEIFLPVLLMCYLSAGTLTELSLPALKALLLDNGWTALTALNTMLLCLFHFPCATTLITIKKEADARWMLLAFIIPVVIGLALCALTTALWTVF